MALISGSQRDIIYGLNQEALTPLSFEGLIFSRFIPVEGEVTQTRLRLTAKDDYIHRDTLVITYHRLNLETLPGLLFRPPRLTPKPTLYELLPSLTTALGITFTEDDLEDAPVSDTIDGFQVDLVAKESSYGWVGHCTLVFYDLPPISIPINDTVIRW